MKDEVYQDILAGNTDRLYTTPEWKEKRKQILKRDNYECQRCIGKYKAGGPLKRIKLVRANTVHHKVEMKDDPTLMLEDDNLISLCHSCHDIINERTPKKFNQPKKKLNEERW